MKIVGVICEYNPFHNGHIYHLNKVKEMFDDALIVLVMSSYFTERGEFSIIDPYNKTKIALLYGVDLVVELPFIYSSQSADIFSMGAISILKKMGATHIVFGSESCDVELLRNIALFQLNDKRYDDTVQSYLKMGYNYPTCMSKAVCKYFNREITNPNDLLGLSYIKEIIKQGDTIIPISIKRTNDYHSKNLDSDIVSASAIRSNLGNSDIKRYVPKEVYDILENKKNIEYFNYLKYKVLLEGNHIKNYQTVDEGIENRIIKYINKVNSLEELINMIKTKRYTYNKLNRMMIHILTGFTKEDALNLDLAYIHVLGFNGKGRSYLNSIKKDIDVLLITNVEKKYFDIMKIDLKVEKIYNLITSNNTTLSKPVIIEKKV